MAETAAVAPNPDADGLVGGYTWWPCDELPSSKYRWADGTLLKRDAYPLYFARVKTRHNTGGEAADEFRLPNVRGKMLVCLDPNDADFDTVGEIGGTKAATMPTHDHSMSGTPSITNGNAQAQVDVGTLDGYSTTDGALKSQLQKATITVGIGTLSVDSTAGSGNNMPPYVVANLIIKVL